MKTFCSLITILIFTQVGNSQNCEALFTTDGSNLTVVFSDLSSSTIEDPIVSWFWDFDDNNMTSSLQNPTYTFSEPGSYDVKLEITTLSGCEADYKFKIRTCAIDLDYSIGLCDGSGMVALNLNINDIYDSAEDIDVILDGQSLPGGPFTITAANPVSLNLPLPGDGLQHELFITSLERDACSMSLAFSLPDCGSDCFLSGLNLTYTQGTVHNVNIGDNFFNPSSVGITLGDIVRFNWIDGGHSTTSDLTSGKDAWNSGVLNAGAQYDVIISNPGTHRYYCIPHGNPGGVGMSGTILANCPTGTKVDLLVNFRTTQANSQGFNIKYDGSFLSEGPFSYQGIGEQSQQISVAGDGKNHIIEVIDVADPSCSISLDYSAPDCNQGGGDPICAIDFTIGAPSDCLVDGTIDFPLLVMVENGGDSFDVLVNGSILSTYSYQGPHTEITINLPGDGNTRTISISDRTKINCSASSNITSPDCSLPCAITQATAVLITSGNAATTHMVKVEDFQFNPSIINIAEGDLIKWHWTGDIPHSTTSDLTSGTNSWDSGILGKGATFTSPELSPGEHPYYCIPHGGPGGLGMSGKIVVLPNCNENGEVSVQVKFNITSKRGPTYEIKVDGQSVASKPYVNGPSQEIIVLLDGDGMAHNIEIIDQEYNTCSASIDITSPNCNGQEVICELTLEASPPEPCFNDSTLVEISIRALNQGDAFLLYIDDQLEGEYPYQGALTILNLNLPGDGLSHTISVTDILHNDCSVNIKVIGPDCSIPCAIENLEVSSLRDQAGEKTHTIFVEDFQFAPKELEIPLGDKIEWIWTGDIPHTTTSDVTDGPNSWRSPLLGKGATFLGPSLSIGSHPYYCEPHGGPGGVGMSGEIKVLAECSDDSKAAYLVNFQISSRGNLGYTLFIDDVEYGSFEYEPGLVQERIVNIQGDGLLHSVIVMDNERIECSNQISFLTVDCNPETCTGLQLDFDIDINYIENIVSLTNNSSGAFNEMIWDFGDGNISTAENPTHQYQDTGSYTICLSILGEGDCTEMKCQEIKLDKNICEVGFEFQNLGSSYTFINSSKIANSNYTSEWSFGDGVTINNQDTVQHSFSTGIFQVCLTVDTESCTENYCETFDFSDACSLFSSEFQFDIHPNNSLSVEFSAQSSGSIDSWLWGFGDGSTSRDSSPIHDYDLPGIYKVCLLAGSSENNCLSSTCKEIQIISSRIEENDYPERMTVSPNPQSVGQSIIINVENINLSSADAIVLIYSLEGEKKFEKPFNLKDFFTIPSNLNSGVYFLKVITESKIYTTKLILLQNN